MTKNPRDDEWAWKGRESLFQKKLANLRNEPGGHTPAKGVTAFQAPKVDPAALMSTTQESLPQTSQEELEARALLDSQTGLLNARQFSSKLQYELKRGMRYKRPVAICMICVDGLKDVKRLYGVEAGEKLIKLAAEAIIGIIRDVDYPARYSADVLAIIFPETNAAGVQVPAERIRETIKNQVIELGGESVFITASIGCASFPAHAREPHELIDKAVQALEMAAERGGDAVLSA